MKIVTDSAADLTPEDIASHGITVAPLYIQFPEGERESEEISRDEFYQRLEAMQPHAPTTVQPSPGDFASLYERLLAAGEEVLSIHISSGLSGTINAARLGAARVGEKIVHLIDTLTLSGGQRFQVLAAARAIEAGWPLEAVRARLEQIRAEAEVVYTLDTLNYLARGGRIGRVQALAGSLLHIKPVIHVDREDGKYTTVGKSRTIARALQDITSHLSNLYGRQALWVSVMHGQFEEKANQLAAMLQDSLEIARLEVLRISPVLGVHTGPGIVGAAVVPMRLMEDV
ncbi:MAG: DegV family protein [Anaerolineae bacterium]